MKTIGQPGRRWGNNRGRVRLLGSVAAAALLLPAVALAQTAVQNGMQSTGNASSETMTLPTIDVSADRQRDANPPTTVGSKLPLAPREVPQTVTTVPRERIEEQKLITLDDAMRQTPGVVVEPRDGNRMGFYSRGFDMTTLQYDGVPTKITEQIFSAPDLAMYDRVEVLKGPAGLLNGFGGPGGTVNLVRKRPTKTLQGYGELSAGSWANYRGEGDISGPLNQAGTVRGRFVGAYQDRNSFMDWTDQKRSLGYGTLAADITPDTTVTVGLYDQRTRYNGPWTMPSYLDTSSGKPVLRTLDVSRSTSLGAEWNRETFRTTGGFAEVEHHIDKDWTVKLATNYTDERYDRKMAYAYNPVSPPNNLVQVLAFKQRYDQTQAAADLSATGNVQAFGRTHEVAFGANYVRTELRGRGANPATTFNYRVNIFAPNANLPEPVFLDWQTDNTTTTESWGTYGVARLQLLDPLKLIVGGRVGWTETTVETAKPANTPDTSASARGKVTPYAGLVYDVNKTVSVYTSVAEIFQPQSVVDASGKVLEPIQGRQYEAGVKADFMGGALHGSLAFFQIEERNRAQSDPAFPTSAVYLAQGKARSRGMELDLSGTVLPGWDVYAGYTFTRTRNLDSSANVGSAFSAIAPMHMFKLWTNYRLPESIDDRLSVGGGMYAQTSMYNELSTLGGARLTQGGYATFDARVAYDATEKVTAAVNVKNIFDRTYYQRINTPVFGNIYGEPRSVLLTLKAKL